jgi:hypothetical protein
MGTRPRHALESATVGDWTVGREDLVLGELKNVVPVGLGQQAAQRAAAGLHPGGDDRVRGGAHQPNVWSTHPVQRSERDVVERDIARIW